MEEGSSRAGAKRAAIRFSSPPLLAVVWTWILSSGASAGVRFVSIDGRIRHSQSFEFAHECIYVCMYSGIQILEPWITHLDNEGEFDNTRCSSQCSSPPLDGMLQTPSDRRHASGWASCTANSGGAVQAKRAWQGESFADLDDNLNNRTLGCHNGVVALISCSVRIPRQGQ